MVILVTGGRDFTDYERVVKVLDEVCRWSKDGHIHIVNGAARGADQLATKWAQERGEKCTEVPVTKAEWDQHGKVAGFLRNQKMLDLFHPDQGVVFPGGNGTQDMLERLFRAGVNSWVVGK